MVSNRYVVEKKAAGIADDLPGSRLIDRRHRLAFRFCHLGCEELAPGEFGEMAADSLV